MATVSENEEQSHERVEKRREVFRKYLESKGLLEALTKVLAEIAQKHDADWPSDPLDYVVNELAKTQPGVLSTQAMENELKSLRERNLQLEAQNATLEAKLASLSTNKH